MNSRTNRNAFSLDPLEFAHRQADKEKQRFMVALMRHLKITQVEIPASEFFKDATIEVTDRIDTGTRVFRIVGELELAK